MNKLIKSAKAILGICIIGMLIINNIVFLHAHKLPNGYIIIHAHPFNKSKDSAPFKMHHHSHSEFFLLHNIHILFFVGIFILGALFFKQLEIYYSYSLQVFLNHFIYHFFKRGPPAAGHVSC